MGIHHMSWASVQPCHGSCVELGSGWFCSVTFSLGAAPASQPQSSNPHIYKTDWGNNHFTGLLWKVHAKMQVKCTVIKKSQTSWSQPDTTWYHHTLSLGEWTPWSWHPAVEGRTMQSMEQHLQRMAILADVTVVINLLVPRCNLCPVFLCVCFFFGCKWVHAMLSLTHLNYLLFGDFSKIV